MNRPLWRWWVFCAALWLHFKTDWRWPGSLLSWSVLPEWLGLGIVGGVDTASTGDGEAPW